MKLIIASLTAATVLASAASAMVAPSQIDPRDAAQNAIGQQTFGAVVSVPAVDVFSDGRSAAVNGSDNVTRTVFATTVTQKTSDLR